jgi:hypothetical protein
MKRQGHWVAGGVLVLSVALPQAFAGATVALQPVRAGGTYTIVGNEIFLPSGGQRVFIEVRLAGWGPQHLKTWQVKIDSSGYQNSTSSIGPAGQPCSGANPTGHAECAQAFGSGSGCKVLTPNGRICEAGFQDKTRSDWVGFGLSVFNAVDISTWDYRYGATTDPAEFVADPGESLYGGTLVLDVPAGAAGTFVVEMVPVETFMNDDTVPNFQEIPIDLLVPARITIGEPLVPKNRYAAFTPGNPGHQTAVRVTLKSLYHPGPPVSTVRTPPDFSSFEGQVRWLGPPSEFPERGQGTGTFTGAALQCTPFFADWGSLGVVQVFGEAILPSSEYVLRQAPIECRDDLGNELCYAPPVTLRTARWGDVAEPFARFDQPAQPDMGDLAAIIDTFRGLFDSLSKTRTQLRGNTVDAAHGVNFVDVTLAADAIRRLPYPYPGPQSCP